MIAEKHKGAVSPEIALERLWPSLVVVKAASSEVS